jgi:branched-chain amino acid transport system permease protein
MIAYLAAMAIIALIYSLLALGLNLHWGHTGLINFGHVAFFAIGAYASAMLTLGGAPIAAGAVAATVLAGLAALPIGWVAVRLRSDYLAIVTIGFSETVRLVLQNEVWLTRGPMGLPGVPRPFGWFGPGANELVYLAMLAVVVAVVYTLLERVVRSPFGRVLRAIREDEDAAAALGKDVVGFKVRSLVLGAAIAGLAGSFYAHYINYVVPDQFLPLVTFYVWIAVILGGSGSNPGALVGTAILMVFLEGTRFVKDWGFALDEVRLAALRFVVVGLALVLLVLHRPQGLLGERAVTDER